jgi:metal-sulfur cluster biosynthetic enzyme
VSELANEPTTQCAKTAPAVPESDVLAALHRVIDPCSQSWQRPLSIVELGLVRRIDVAQPTSVRVDISLTTPFCMALPVIVQAIEQRVGEVPGVTGVDVRVDPVVVWTIDLMTDEGRERLLAHRRRDAGTLAAAAATGRP